jgi:hypothetical protein
MTMNTNSGSESGAAAGASGPVKNGAATAESSPLVAAPGPSKTLVLDERGLRAGGVRGSSIAFAVVDRVITTSGLVLKDKNWTVK